MIIRIVVERKNGQTPNEDYGQNLGAMGLETLDLRLEDVPEVAPLSDFMVTDAATLEQAIPLAPLAEQPALRRQLDALRERPEWHDPREGLNTVRALMRAFPRDEHHEGVLADLTRMEAVLRDAADAGDVFRLNARTSY